MNQSMLDSSPLLLALKKAASAMPVSVFWFDKNGKILGFNQKLISELGYSDAEKVPSTFLEVNPTFTLLDFKKMWKELKDQEHISFSTEHMTEDDMIYPVKMEGTLLNIEGEDVCMVFVENLMDKKRFEDLLQLTSEVANVGGWEWDRVADEFVLTDTARDILSFPKGQDFKMEDFMKLLNESINAKHAKTLGAHIQKAIDDGTNYEMSFDLKIGNQHKEIKAIGIAERLEDQTIKLYGVIQDEAGAANRTEEMYYAQYCLDYAVDMIYWITEDWTIDYANATACDLIGYSKNEIIGQSLSLIDPEVAPKLEAIREVLESKERLSIETFHTTKSGEKIPVAVEAETISYKGKKYYCAFVRDLRQVVEKEELIDMSFATMDSALDMIYWFDDDGHIRYVNETACKLLEYQKKELVGQHVSFITKSTGIRLKELKKEMEANQEVIFDSTHISKSGEEIPVRVEAKYISHKGKIYNCSFIKDLREIQAREELLEMSQVTIANSPNLVYWISENGIIEYANDTACKTMGYTNEELVGEHLEIINPGIRKRFDAIQMEIKAAGLLSFDTRHVTKSGEQIPVEINARHLFYKGKSYYCTNVRDLSSVRQKDALIELSQFTLDNSPDLMFWVDEEGIIQNANKAVFETMGFTNTELIGQHVEVINPGAREGWSVHFAELEQLGKVTVDNAIHYSKSGEAIPLQIKASFMTFKDKKMNCAVARDLRKLDAKDKIIEMSQVTLDGLPEMVLWVDEEGIIEYANSKATELLGYSREELLGSNLEMLNNSKLGEWKIRFAELEEKKRVVTESVHQTKSGAKIPIRIESNLLIHNGKKYNCEMIQDLRVENRQARMIDLAKASLDNSLDMIFWLNEDGTFRYVNNSMIKTTGYSKEAFKKLTIVDVIANQNMEGYKKGWEQLRAGAVLKNMPRELLLKSGVIMPVEMTIFMVNVAGDYYTTTVMRDVTEEREKEAKILSQIKEIERLRNEAIAENISLKEDFNLNNNFTNIISKDPAYRKVLKQIEQVAQTEATALVLGETGTGKELVARAIHQLSNRSDKLMVKINCGALPENLIESEFFGHERGSFTGAHQQKIGKFERAHKATIFLDEIGELPLDLQSKLLRVLQEGEFERVGGTKTLTTDVRVIAATNRNLEEQINKGKFREDLYYRLNVFPINNIPLRERREDIPLLTDFFVKKYCKKMNKVITEVGQGTMDALYSYAFPGNVRELENLIERAVILSPGKVLSVDMAGLRKNKVVNKKFLPMDEQIKAHILEALRMCKGKVSGVGGAAQLLQMKDKTLYSRMTKYGIAKNDYLKQRV